MPAGGRARKERTLPFTVSKLLVLVAVICFVLAAFGVQLAPVDLIALGLAFGFASFLVP